MTAIQVEQPLNESSLTFSQTLHLGLHTQHPRSLEKQHHLCSDRATFSYNLQEEIFTGEVLMLTC